MSTEASHRLARSTPGCTGLTASWCPHCGQCNCPVEFGERSFESEDCPLHSSASNHGHRSSVPPVYKTGPWLPELLAELARARAKFPGNRFLLAALAEETGEVSRALLQQLSKEKLRQEAIQVACVAIRIYEEGDATFDDITPQESKP